MVLPRTRLPITALALAGVLCGLSVLASAPAARGGGFIAVNSAADTLPPGPCEPQVADGCTLREAILLANSSQGFADTIIFVGPAFAGTNIIHLNSELPYFTDPAGVTVDGDLPDGERVLIVPSGNDTADYGLVFTGPGAVGNVTVKNFIIFAFDIEGLQVCGGPAVNGVCTGAVSGVTLENVRVTSSGTDGIDIFGSSIENVELTDVEAIANGGSGVLIRSGGDLSGVEIIRGESKNDGHGYSLSGGVANNISFRGGARAVENGLHGVDIFASALSGLTIDASVMAANSGRGVNVDIVGSLSNVEVPLSIINLNQGTGMYIKAGSFGAGIFDGVIAEENNEGIRMEAGEISEVTVEGSTIKNNDNAGIFFDTDRGVGNVVFDNSLSGNSHGVRVQGTETPGSTQVRISRNSIFGSLRAGIDLIKSGDDPFDPVTLNDTGDTDEGPNKLLNFPVLTGATPEALTGTACAGCLIELFIASRVVGQFGEGETFLRDATADGSGNFSVSLCQLNQPAGTVVTATATDTDGNTSEFSQNVALISATANCPPPTASPTPTGTPTATPIGQTPTPTPTPTPIGQTPSPTPTPTPVGQTPSPTPTPTPVGQTPSPTGTPGPGQPVAWGDGNCSGGAPNPIDSLLTLRHNAALSTNTGNCPEFGTNVSLVASALTWGDVDCSSDVDPVDSLKLLRFDAGLNVSQPQGCPALGVDVTITN